MKTSTQLIIALVLVAGILAVLLFQKNDTLSPASVGQNPVALPPSQPQAKMTKESSEIDELTNEAVVVPFVKKQGRLPAYYITKNEARKQGWIANAGNLCDVLPGKAIGGDIFTNRQKLLPVKPGRRWYEADLNYNCGRRNADRILFSNDGEVYITHDHYRTVEKR